MNKINDSIQNPGENKIDNDESVTLTKEEFEKLQAEKAELSQTKENLVNEIKDLRAKKQLTEQEKEELANKVKTLETKPDDGQVDVVKQVEELLSRKEKETRVKNKEKAMNQFLSEHPEFSDSNDEAGLRKSAFEKKLGMFNTENLTETEEFLSIFKTANKLLGKDETEIDSTQVPNIPVKPKTPSDVDKSKLTQAELDYVEKHFGGKVERYIELKTKYPEVVKSL